MRKMRLTLIPFVFLLVAGCQFFPITDGQDTKTPHRGVEASRLEAKQLSKLLSYYESLDGLGNYRLKIRLAQLRRGLEKDGCGTARLKSAMILSQLPAYGSNAGVKAILGSCLSGSFIRQSAEGKLALLLRDLIERRRAANGAQAEIEDYHRKLAALQGENQELHQQVKKLHKQVEKLHKQLEGLKAIEKSIQQRNQR